MSFLNDHFMLRNQEAIRLYEHIKTLPICDYHCHLDPRELADNVSFDNITQVWLGHDHYKWRLMRWYGVDEEYITGSADSYDKFIKWAEVLEHSIGNPIYTWSHMELKTYFDIHEPLTRKNADRLWHEINKKLSVMRARDFVEISKVTDICTTDDPIDDLKYHKQLKEEINSTSVLPTFRPDQLLKLNKAYVDKLSQVTKIYITDIDSLLEAIESRIKYFDQVGCRISDHSIENPLFILTDKAQASKLFHEMMKDSLNETDEIKLTSYMMVELSKLYKKYDWSMQLHYGAMRNNNKCLFDKLGKDSGLDALNDFGMVKDIAGLLDAIGHDLPRTIIYPLNPKDNTALSVLSGCYQLSNGHVQLGAAWWFNDHKKGIEDQIETLASTGMISQSVGMLTDSRSLLSYTRHDYYRRILCNYFGRLIEDGELHYSEVLEDVVSNICYYNAKSFFRLGGSNEY